MADCARDGAVARAVHDYLYAVKHGKVSATLTMLSADLDTRTLVVSRNTDCPVIMRNEYGMTIYEETVNPIGVHKKMKPWTLETDLEAGLIAITYSDGIASAGKKNGKSLEWQRLEQMIMDAECEKADDLAENILQYALTLDKERPGDDMTVLVMTVLQVDREPKIGRMQVTYPV